jgi:hypothetical protein
MSSTTVRIVTLGLRRREGASTVGTDKSILHPYEKTFGMVLVVTGCDHDLDLIYGCCLRWGLWLWWLGRLFKIHLIILFEILIQTCLLFQF